MENQKKIIILLTCFFGLLPLSGISLSIVTSYYLVVLAQILIIFLMIPFVYPFSFVTSYFYFTLLLLNCIILSTIASYFLYGNNGIEKSIYSFILLFLIFLSAPLLVESIVKVSICRLEKILKIILLIFLIIGYFGFLLQQKGLVEGKNLLFFSEPSHYAIILLPVATISILICTNYLSRFVLITLIFLLALLVENLTMLLSSAFITFLIMSKSIKTDKILKTILIFFIFTFIFVIMNKSYILDRVPLFTISKQNYSNDDLSSLVYLSGWDRAKFSLLDSYLLGQGFNRMGYVRAESYYQDVLTYLGFSNLNLYDGGTTGAKIICELGIFGIMLILMYLFYFCKLLREFIKNKINNFFDVFFTSYFLCYSFELFIRGIGYFSPNILLFVGSIYWIFKSKFTNEHCSKHS
ncbi:hypothetical protein [Thermodesulfovibrio yellowstonii]|nr:hypothetical protein [Thermodesulfovibrio islandicus]